MLKKFIKIILCVIMTAVTAVFSFCPSLHSYGYIRNLQASEYFNAPSEFLYYYNETVSGEKERAQSLLKEIDTDLKKIEYNLSAESDGGDIYRFNHASAGETVTVSEETYKVFLNAYSLWEKTDGAYNPSVRLLVDLWGFSPRFSQNGGEAQPYDRTENEPPKQKYIDAFKTITNFGDIKANEIDGVYTLKKPETSVTVDGVIYSMQLDFGGYGKGYASKITAEIITGAGFNFGYVSFGGSSLHLLARPDEKNKNAERDWQLKLTYPSSDGAKSGDFYASVYAKNSGVATSGDYERFYEKDGIIYSHIIDATTGAPINNGVCTATIIGKDSAEADALTTALLVMGKDKAIDFVNKELTGSKVIFAVREDNGVLGVYTNLSKNEITLNFAHKLRLRAVGDGNGRIKEN